MHVLQALLTTGHTYLHEHAKSCLQQVGEARRHVFNVHWLSTIRVENFFNDLFQQWLVGGLEKNVFKCYNMFQNNSQLFIDSVTFALLFLSQVPMKNA